MQTCFQVYVQNHGDNFLKNVTSRVCTSKRDPRVKLRRVGNFGEMVPKPGNGSVDIRRISNIPRFFAGG